MLFVSEERPQSITLRALRYQLGLTQREMAAVFGVKHKTYGEYEAGRRRVLPAIVTQVKEQYGYCVLSTQDRHTFIDRRFERMGLEKLR